MDNKELYAEFEIFTLGEYDEYDRYASGSVSAVEYLEGILRSNLAVYSGKSLFHAQLKMSLFNRFYRGV